MKSTEPKTLTIDKFEETSKLAAPQTKRIHRTCSPCDPRFVGLNPAEVDGFFQGVYILSTSTPGGT